MRVFIIKNKISEDIFVVRNKQRFCSKYNLTPRLLDYTVKGASATRYQEWHKEYQIVEKLEFVPDGKGDRALWDTSEKGYCVKESGKHFREEKVQETNNEMERENELLRKELTKTLKQKQRLQDQLNLNRKLGREQYRYENICDIIINNYKDLINSNVPTSKYIEKPYNEDISAVLCISDLHWSQKVEESNNRFNMSIADIRLGRIFDQFQDEIELRNITDVNLLFLGDLIHAQSILTKPDMKLSGEVPEIQAGLMCFQTLAKYIDRLVERYNVTMAGVVGNESRFSNHMLPSNLQQEARNNIDVMIFEMLKQRYRNHSNVYFTNDGDELENVVEINGKKILLTHGNSPAINHKDLDKSFIHIKARLEPIYGEIDYMVLGHIHSTKILDRVFRNASLVGSNSYSNTLGFSKSFVAQNMMIIDINDTKVFSLKAE